MKSILWFIAGATAGSLIAWRLAKRRYEAIANEEIQSVKEAFRAKNEEKKAKNEQKSPKKAQNPAENEVKPWRPTEEDKEEMNEKIADLGYNTLPESEKGEGGHPYIITPDQFVTECQFYEKRTLSLWANGVISEENDGINDFSGMYNNAEVDNLLGLRNLDSMGAFQDGVLHVRNDILECDFEILEEDEDYPIALDEG